MDDTIKYIDSRLDYLKESRPTAVDLTNAINHLNNSVGFNTIVATYGTDIPFLEGNHTRYLYEPGTILVAHGDNEALPVGDLEDAVEAFQKLILHSLKL